MRPSRGGNTSNVARAGGAIPGNVDDANHGDVDDVKTFELPYPGINFTFRMLPDDQNPDYTVQTVGSWLDIQGVPENTGTSDSHVRDKKEKRDSSRKKRNEKKQNIPMEEPDTLKITSDQVWESEQRRYNQDSQGGKHVPECCKPISSNTSKMFLIQSFPIHFVLELMHVACTEDFKRLIEKHSLPECPRRNAADTYWFHFHQEYRKVCDVQYTYNEESDSNPQFHSFTKFDFDSMHFEYARRLGIQWFHTTLVVQTKTTHIFSEISERLCAYVAQITGNDVKQIKKDTTIFYGITVAGHQKSHSHLHINNENSRVLNEAMESEPHIGAVYNHSGIFFNERDIGYELYMPLTLEGMTIRLAIPDDHGNIEIVPYYIPFGCAIIIRADSVRGGWYGSEGTKIFRAVIATCRNPWLGRGKFVPENSPLYLADKRILALIGKANKMMVISKRPKDVQPDVRLHLGSMALDKYKTKVLENFTSEEYKRMFDQCMGEMKRNAYEKYSTLVKDYSKLFKVYPSWWKKPVSKYDEKETTAAPAVPSKKRRTIEESESESS